MPDAGRHGRQEPTGLPAELAGLDEASAAVFRAFVKTLRLHRQFMVRHFAESASTRAKPSA